MLHYEFLNSEKSPHYSQFLSIYREAFPPEERQSSDIINQRIHSCQGHLVVGIFNKEVISIAILWDLDDCSFSLLEYFAVKSSWRGKSIGSRFLDFLSSTPQFNKRELIAEVEDPKEGTDTHNRLNRLRFYFRNSFFLLNGVRSIVPALTGNTPTPILLLVRPFQKESHYSNEVIERVIRKIFTDIYNVNKGNPGLERIINQLPVIIHLSPYYSPTK